MEEQSPLELRLAAITSIRNRIPVGAFGLVGVDSFEEAGDELYLISIHMSREDAEAALAARRACEIDDPSHLEECLYVYEGPSPGTDAAGR